MRPSTYHQQQEQDLVEIGDMLTDIQQRAGDIGDLTRAQGLALDGLGRDMDRTDLRGLARRAGALVGTLRANRHYQVLLCLCAVLLVLLLLVVLS
jgi:hypothetical protein